MNASLESRKPGNAAGPSAEQMPSPLASVRHTSRLVLIVCGVALIGYLQHQRTAPLALGSRLPLYLSVVALQLLFVWFVRKGIRAFGYSLCDLLGRTWRAPIDPLRDLILAAFFVIGLHFCAVVLHRILGPSISGAAFLLPRLSEDIVAWVFVALVAGLSEEIVYRGYLQAQVHALTGSLTGAIGSQAIVFALAHLYQGWRSVLITFVYGLAFGILAACRKSIIPGAIAHTTIDLVGGLFPH